MPGDESLVLDCGASLILFSLFYDRKNESELVGQKFRTLGRSNIELLI